MVLVLTMRQRGSFSKEDLISVNEPSSGTEDQYVGLRIAAQHAQGPGFFLQL